MHALRDGAQFGHVLLHRDLHEARVGAVHDEARAELDCGRRGVNRLLVDHHRHAMCLRLLDHALDHLEVAGVRDLVRDAERRGHVVRADEDAVDVADVEDGLEPLVGRLALDPDDHDALGVAGGEVLARALAREDAIGHRAQEVLALERVPLRRGDAGLHLLDGLAVRHEHAGRAGVERHRDPVPAAAPARARSA